MPDPAPSVLAIMAHPDDIEFVCAGTLILLANAGCPVTMINLARGDCGSAELAPDEIAAVRLEEARGAAQIIGARHQCLGFDDLTIYRNETTVRQIVEVIRDVRPGIVFTHPPADYMSDHEETCRLVRDACFYAPMPNYQTGAAVPCAPADQVPYLYFGDPLQGHDYFGQKVPAGFHVDISSVFERKVAMLCAHVSQRDWLRRQHGVDEYVDLLKSWNRERGEEAGTEYAEAYRQYRGHGFPGENILQSLLGGRVST